MSQNEKSEKRKHKTLTVIEKAEIIKKLDKGEKFSDLASFYGVGRATIYDIKNNRDKIEKFAKDLDRESDRRVVRYDYLNTWWERDKILLLIDLLHAEPALWDINCTEYRDKIKKVDAVRSIAVQLNTSEDEITKKIKSLKAQFRREEKKMQNGTNDEKVWFAYNQLTFLSENNQAVTTQSNTEDNSSNTITAFKEEPEEVFCQTPSPDHSMNSYVSSFELPADETSTELPATHSSYNLPSTQSSYDLPEVKPSYEFPGEQISYKFLGEQTSYEHPEEQTTTKRTRFSKDIKDNLSDTSEVENQFDCFGKYVAAQLKSLSAEQAILAQDEIHRIITKRKLIDIKNK